MSDYEIRAVTKLTLDSVKEKDIIEEIEGLIEHRKLGTYITNLLRFAAEHREDLEELGFDGRCRGLTDTRKKMINGINDDLRELKAKVDCVFDIALALKAAVEIGHVTALETQVDNVIAAQIVTQTQMNKLRRNIGNNIDMVFNGQDGEIRKATIDKAAKEAADLALIHYGAEINDLANAFNSLKLEFNGPVSAGGNISRQTDYIERNLKIAGSAYEDAIIERHTESTKTVEETKPSESGGIKTLDSVEDIKFNGDMDALSSFFGM